MFLGLLLEVSSDSPQDQISDQDIHHHSVRAILLYSNVVWTQKCRGTYQKGIQKCLHSQFRYDAESYIDDLVIKTREDERLIFDLAKTFDNLRKFKMKLNLEM
jgi:hypothetical protein